MKIFHIYTNLLKDTGGETTAYIRNYLEERGCICKDQVDGTVEGIIVLGGDGTMLRAAGEYLGRHIPMIGVNLGTLGYLAEVEQDQIETALDSLIADKYEVESRMMLSGIPVIAGESMAPMIALNDIVITRKGALHVINFNIYVNGQLLSTYNADGMINDDVRRFINFELSNQYMLFLRNCDGLNVSDKSFKVLKLDNNRITLEEEL